MSFVPYLHLLAALLYLGGMIFEGGLLVPMARRLRGAQKTVATIGHLVKILHPVSLASLGLMIMTGAAMLTDLKVALGGRYFTQLFAFLGPKLLVVFLLALLNSYQFFALGLRLTRSVAQEVEGQVAVTDEEMATMIPTVDRLQRCAWAGAALGGAAVYLGLAMGHG